jgi:hypothetical protein
MPGFELRQTPQLQWLTSRPLTDIVRYSASSHPDFRYGPIRASGAALIALRDDVALPAGFNPRTIATGRRTAPRPRAGHRTGAGAGAGRAAPAAHRRLPLHARPGVSGPHSADEFWFDRREGFCEHIASAFVILMRALDVPARIDDRLPGWRAQRSRRLLGGAPARRPRLGRGLEARCQGWVRVDPTGAVSPGRTGSLERLRAPQGAIATDRWSL